MSEAAPEDDRRAQPAGDMPARLSMVVLGAGDLAALRRYYRALGWPEQAGASDSLARFELGGVTLALYSQSEPREPDDTAIEARSAVTLVVPVETRNAVDAACSAAVGAGARAESGPQDQPWGGRSGIVADPEGNRWEVLWVPRTSAEGDAPSVTG